MIRVYLSAELLDIERPEPRHNPHPSLVKPSFWQRLCHVELLTRQDTMIKILGPALSRLGTRALPKRSLPERVTPEIVVTLPLAGLDPSFAPHRDYSLALHPSDTCGSTSAPVPLIS